MKEKDLGLGRQIMLAGIVVARSYRGPEPSFNDRQRALEELKAFPNLHPQVVQMIYHLAPFGKHREWAATLLPKAPAPAMASAGHK